MEYIRNDFQREDVEGSVLKVLTADCIWIGDGFKFTCNLKCVIHHELSTVIMKGIAAGQDREAVMQPVHFEWQL